MRKGPSLSSSRQVTSHLVEGVYEKLREQLVTWEISPNELIVESKLAAQFDVSRTPVREALAQLARDGLVESIPRIGYRVTTISIRDLHEIFDLRVLLEGKAAYLAALNYTETELTKIDEAHQEWGLHLEEDEPSPIEYLRYHDSFHFGVAELAGSKRLFVFLKQLLTDSSRLRMSDPAMSKEGLLDEEEESRKLLLAIRARDCETAAKLMEEHIQSSKQRALVSLMEGGLSVQV